MGAKGMLVAMVAGTALVMAFGARRSEPHRAGPAKATRPEEPWLSNEAAAQIVGPGGTLGPLFHDVMLGGPAPAPEIRARIAEFAKQNHVTIDLETTEGLLTAIRFEVTYAGCCGYEGADVLALRLGRRSTGVCCVCGPDTWINDWAVLLEPDIHLRASVRTNRVTARWEPTVTTTELVERANSLLGMAPDAVAKRWGDRWAEVDSNHYLLEVPYPTQIWWDFGRPVPLRDREDLGLHVLTHAGRITTVRLSLRTFDDDQRAELKKALRPWKKPDREIEAYIDEYGEVTITAR